MAKRQHSVSLSFVLLRFAVIMSGSMMLCFLVWFTAMTRLQNTGFVYRKSVPYQQAELLLSGDPDRFVSPDDSFLPEYALFTQDGKVLESNEKGKKLETLTQFLKEGVNSTDIIRHTYSNGNTIIIRWHYRAEFVNPVLRRTLPPFEYLWLATLGTALVLCLLLNTLWLGRRLAAKLKLFSKVSEKVASQDLDFAIPHAGIREYDQALGAMEDMRAALYSSLSSQWLAQQEREAEIAALAHDLKTPLTLVGGNAELLLDEGLPESSLKIAQRIIASNDRAKQYVASLLDTTAGVDESFEMTSLPVMFDELCLGLMAIADARKVCLQTQNSLKGTACIQKDHMLRALGNVVQNAIEHTHSGRNVYLEGRMAGGGWQIVVRDEGPGFSREALRHATERLWRGDAGRSADGHNGLGLWFASEVIKTHAGQIELGNCDSGGVVTIRLLNHHNADSFK